MRLFPTLTGNRPLALLVALTLLSLLSMALGTKATIVHKSVRRVAAMSAYPFLVAQRATASGTDYVLDLFLGYNDLRTENEARAHDLVKMKQSLTRLVEVQRENRRLRTMLKFQRDERRLSLLPASVLGTAKGLLTIDRGALHGVRESMGVITADGVVGIITEVGGRASTVATLHHPYCNVGAMVRRNRIRAYDGIIKASKSDLSVICTLEYIDINDDVRQGDLVVTSPESVFPSGYPVGTITRVHHSETLWRYADVMPSVDPYRLDEVFVVIKASLTAEELAGPSATGDFSNAPEMPDNRTIQDRFAP